MNQPVVTWRGKKVAEMTSAEVAEYRAYYREYRKKERAEDPQRHRDAVKKWKKENPLTRKAIHARYRAKRKSLGRDSQDAMESGAEYVRCHSPAAKFIWQELVS